MWLLWILSVQEPHQYQWHVVLYKISLACRVLFWSYTFSVLLLLGDGAFKVNLWSILQNKHRSRKLDACKNMLVRNVVLDDFVVYSVFRTLRRGDRLRVDSFRDGGIRGIEAVIEALNE